MQPALAEREGGGDQGEKERERQRRSGCGVGRYDAFFGIMKAKELHFTHSNLAHVCSWREGMLKSPN